MSLGGSERAATRWNQPAPQGELGRLIGWEALGRLGLDISTACFAPGPGDPERAIEGDLSVCSTPAS